MAVTRAYEAAVQGGKLHHFSVSQVKTFLRCPRAWAGDKIFHAPRGESPGATLGGKLHKQPEAYYRDGTRPTQEAFLAAMPGLPARDPRLLVEHALTDPLLYVDGVPLEGYSDLIVPPGVRGDDAEIWDWKFVKNFRYTEDPENDLQMLTYGYWAAQKWPGITHVSVNLVYLEAKGADFKPRRCVVPVARCEQMWLDVVAPAVRAMSALVAAAPAKVLDAPESPDACEAGGFAPCRAYGGCGLASQCGKPLRSNLKRGSVDAADAALLAAFDKDLK